jgi:hypothetical protein
MTILAAPQAAPWPVLALTSSAYASRMVLPPIHAKLASGMAGLYREGVEPSGSRRKVSDFPCRTHRRSAGRRDRRRPSAPVPARPDHLRSLALSAGTDEEARRLAQWRPVQGLGSAIRVDPGSCPGGRAPRQNWGKFEAHKWGGFTGRLDKLKQHADGDRQFKVLGAVLDHGLAAVEAACAEALGAGIASGDVILTVLARRSAEHHHA